MKPGPFHALFGFVAVWFGSRPYRKLLLGIPAVLLSMAVLLGMIARPFYTTEKKTHRYRVAAVDAIDAKDMETARVCAEKLWALDPDNHATLFYVASRLLTVAGGEQLGQEYIERLAPEHEPGYAPAHRWMARGLLTSQNPQMAGQRTIEELAEKHLKLADEISKQDVEGKFLWYLLYARTGENDKALAYLQAAALQAPQLAFDLMQIQLSRGNIDEARASAVAASKYLRGTIDDPARDAPRVRLQLARVLQVLGDSSAARETLNAAQDRFPDDEDLHAASVQMLESQMIDLENSREPDIFIWNQTITQLHEFEARELVQRRLFALARKKDPLQILPGVVKRWVQLLDSTEQASRFLDQLGANAAAVGNLELGIDWIQQAVELDDQNHTALNNLAWVLYQAETPDLTRALELVNRALTIAPDDHRYRETRGQILVARQQWNDAVSDLEYALNGLPDKAEVHESLAKCYNELGNHDLAQAHQNAAGL